MVKSIPRKIHDKLTTFHQNESGNVVVNILVTVIIVIVLYSLVSVIGYQIDSSVTIPGYTDEVNKTGGSQWNGTVNSKLPTGIGLWETIGPLTQLLLLVAVIVSIVYIVAVRLGGLGGGGDVV